MDCAGDAAASGRNRSDGCRSNTNVTSAQRGFNGSTSLARIHSEGRKAYRLGALMQDNQGRRGRITMVYADYPALVDSLSAPPNWYEMQEVQPLTEKRHFWYALLLQDGGEIVVGHDDMRSVEG